MEKTSPEKEELNNKNDSEGFIVSDDDKINQRRNHWGKKIESPDPILLLNEVPILRLGGLLLIKAAPKVGKSSNLEAIVASYLSNNHDFLKYKLKLRPEAKILLIDTEQNECDSLNSFNRIFKRAGYHLEDEEPKDITKLLIHMSFKGLASDEMVEGLKGILNKNKDVGLVIIDVATDFAPDIMENKDARKFIEFSNSINPNIGIIVTVHVNQESPNDKARGHIGSELERKAECTLMLKKTESGMRSIEIQLNRMSQEGCKVFYNWNKELNMFTSADFVESKLELNGKNDIRIVQEMFKDKKEANRDFLKDNFMEFTETSEENFNLKMKHFKKRGLIFQGEQRALWKININI